MRRPIFGRYRPSRNEMTDPFFAIGFLVHSCGGNRRRCGLYVTIGRSGLYGGVA